MADYVQRRAAKTIELALADTRIVVVNGARQVGKSTLVRVVTAGRADVAERRLDRPTDLQGARSDPESFVDHPGLLVVDEIQRAPELVLPIKAKVDADDRPGQFLLTGSARLLGLRSLPDALIGRTETVELWPFSQGEIDRSDDHFVDAIFEEHDRFSTGTGECDRDEYLARAVRGGFPEAVRRDDGRRSRWFASYINDLIDRDVTQLSEIQRRPDLDRLLRMLAGRMATPIQVQNVANALNLPKSTIERYVALFEEVFLIKRLPAWSSSQTGRAVGLRKLLFVDTGLAAHASGGSLARLRRDRALAGPVLENFVLAELARQLTWAETFARLYHYRDRDGREVDAVIEHDDGRIVGIEVKAASSVAADDFMHLTYLRRRIGDRLHRGLVLYTGDRVVPFGPGLWAVPIDALWRTPS